MRSAPPARRGSRSRVRRRILHLRFAGQEATLEIEWAPDTSIAESVRERYEQLYGHRPENREVELESLRVVASSLPGAERRADPGAPAGRSSRPARAPSLFRRHAGRRCPPSTARSSTRARASTARPWSSSGTAPPWSSRAGGPWWTASGALILERVAAESAITDDRTGPSRSGWSCSRSASSRWSRRWASGWSAPRSRPTSRSGSTSPARCSIPRGELVANAPHIPVHLGALGLCVRRLVETLPMRPGDVVVTNHPVVRRLAPARRDGGHAGLRRGAAAAACWATWPAGPTTPRSAAACPARCRHREQPGRGGRGHPAALPDRAGRAALGDDPRPAPRRPLADPQRRGQPGRPARRGRGQPCRGRVAARPRRDPRRGNGAALHGAAEAAGREPHPRGAARDPRRRATRPRSGSTTARRCA